MSLGICKSSHPGIFLKINNLSSLPPPSSHVLLDENGLLSMILLSNYIKHFRSALGTHSTTLENSQQRLGETLKLDFSWASTQDLE